jgi:hypothetical protein
VTTAPPLFYVVDWLPPDFGAVGQYAAIFARDLATGGRDVKLIGLTSSEPQTTTEQFPGGGQLETVRLHARLYEKPRYFDRLLWTVRTNLRLVREVVRDPRARRAEVLFTGAPPFMLFFILLAKLARRTRFTYRITDFYPEVLIAELGRRWWLSAILCMTWFLRRRVDAFEALGEDQRRILVAGGIDPGRITVKRDASPVLFRGDEQPLRPPPPLRDAKILLYSGNYSTAHDVDTVVGGLIRHHRGGVGVFGLWLNATGARADIVAGRLRDAGVPVAHSPPCPLAELPRLLLAADVQLISLRPEFSGIVLPSKVYGCIAAGRPILFVGPADSDVHLLCREARLPAYERIEPGDIDAFAAALDRLARQDAGRKIAASAG